MAAKDLKFSEEARGAMLKGVNTLANAGALRWAEGANVVHGKNSVPTVITKDA